MKDSGQSKKLPTAPSFSLEIEPSVLRTAQLKESCQYTRFHFRRLVAGVLTLVGVRPFWDGGERCG